MQIEKVTDLTVEELKAFVNALVDERIKQLQTAKPIDKTRLKQVMESVERHRWTPPSGTPSVVEMLREDRDR